VLDTKKPLFKTGKLFQEGANKDVFDQ